MVGEDGTRTEHDFLCRCVEAAIKAGATTINIPDTVGYTMPDEYRALFRMVRERVPNADKAIFSVHCHNDLGMAVANSLAGVEGGARQIECTINGIGERAGNAALEEVVMAIKTRGDVLPVSRPASTPRMLTRASKLVSNVDLVPGAVQQGDRRPERLRARERHPSGRHAEAHPDLRDHDAGIGRRLEDLAGHGQAFRAATPSAPSSRRWATASRDNQFEDAFERFKDLADRKKHVYDEDIEALVDEHIATRARPHQAGLADGHRRHARPAARHHEARHRRRAS